MDLRQRLDVFKQNAPSYTVQFIDWELGPPATDADVAAFEQAVGFKVDERFLDLFRSVNGFTFSWVMYEGEATRKELEATYVRMRQALLSSGGFDCVGSFSLPSLAELLRAPDFQPNLAGPHDTLKLLGGFNEQELRSSMRWIDIEHLVPSIDRGYHRTGLLLHPRFPDPVCVFTSDETAALEDAHPMRARTFIELACAGLGGTLNKQRLSYSRGYGGNHRLLELDPGAADGPWWFDGGGEVRLNGLHSQLQAQTQTQSEEEEEQPQPQAQPQAKPVQARKQAKKPETKPTSKTARKPKAEPKPKKPKTKAATKPKTKAATKPKTKAATKTQPKTQPKTKAAKAKATKAKATKAKATKPPSKATKSKATKSKATKAAVQPKLKRASKAQPKPLKSSKSSKSSKSKSSKSKP